MRRMRRTDRFRLLAVMVLLVCSLGLVIGSIASFAADAARASNVNSTGMLAMSNTSSGMSTTIANMVPGDFHTGTVKIKNTGTAKGDFYLEPVIITADTKGLANQCDLVINEGVKRIYSGPLSGLKQKDLGSWNANESHTYTFKVTFPDSDRAKPSGRGKYRVGRDNAFMGATTTATFNWTAVPRASGHDDSRRH